MELCNKQRAKQIRILFADRTLREFGQKDLVTIHDGSEIELVFSLPDHAPNKFRAKKCVQASEKWSLWPSDQERVFLLPVIDDIGVLYRLQELGTKVRFDQEPPQVYERTTAFAFQKGKQ